MKNEEAIVEGSIARYTVYKNLKVDQLMKT